MLSYPGGEEGLGPGGRGRVTKPQLHELDSENYMSSMCMKENNDAKSAK